MLHLLICSEEKKKPRKCVFLQQSDKQLTMLKVPTCPGGAEGGPLLRRARPVPHLPAMPGRCGQDAGPRDGLVVPSWPRMSLARSLLATICIMHSLFVGSLFLVHLQYGHMGGVVGAIAQRQNIVLSLADCSGTTCITSQCSTILPLSSSRKISMLAPSRSPGHSVCTCTTT
jgi:hypothetical protein